MTNIKLPDLSDIKKGKRYPNEMKLTALSLRAMGYSFRQIAKALDIGIATAFDWVNDVQFDEVALKDLAEQLRARIASRLLVNANTKMNLEMEDHRLDKSSSFQLNIMKKNDIELARLLLGESTENIAVIGKKVIEIKDKKSQLENDAQDLESEIADIESKIDLMNDSSDSSDLDKKDDKN